MQAFDSTQYAAELESDIQIAWGRAAAALPCISPDPQKTAELVAALRDCAARAKAIGFLSGERELLRMAGFLERRLGRAEYPQYAADRLIR
jgi:hypothetical protein